VDGKFCIGAMPYPKERFTPLLQSLTYSVKVRDGGALFSWLTTTALQCRR